MSTRSARPATPSLPYTDCRWLSTGQLMVVGNQWEELGSNIYAAEAYAAGARIAAASQDARAATRLRHRAETMIGLCERVSTPGLRFSSTAAALTAREREIAGLARGGISSKQIAAQLVLSVRTRGMPRV